MKIEFTPFGLIYTDDTDIYDVKGIIIDEEDKKIDAYDEYGMSIATIHYEDSRAVGVKKYDMEGKLTGDWKDIINYGEIIHDESDNR